MRHRLVRAQPRLKRVALTATVSEQKSTLGVGGGSRRSEIEKYDRIFLISLLSSGNAATLVWTTTRLRVTKLENWDDGSRRFAWHFAQTAGQAPVAG